MAGEERRRRQGDRTGTAGGALPARAQGGRLRPTWGFPPLPPSPQAALQLPTLPLENGFAAEVATLSNTFASRKNKCLLFTPIKGWVKKLKRSWEGTGKSPQRRGWAYPAAPLAPAPATPGGPRAKLAALFRLACGIGEGAGRRAARGLQRDGWGGGLRPAAALAGFETARSRSGWDLPRRPKGAFLWEVPPAPLPCPPPRTSPPAGTSPERGIPGPAAVQRNPPYAPRPPAGGPSASQGPAPPSALGSCDGERRRGFPRRACEWVGPQPVGWGGTPGSREEEGPGRGSGAAAGQERAVAANARQQPHTHKRFWGRRRPPRPGRRETQPAGALSCGGDRDRLAVTLLGAAEREPDPAPGHCEEQKPL